MNRLFSIWRLVAVLLVASMALFTTGCSKVTAGHVGIKFNLLGGDKGVQAQAVGPGYYWLTPNEELYIFPTFTQNYVWTAGSDLGSEGNESLTFQSVEGLSVNADVGISYAIEADKVPLIFQKYRKGVDEITDLYLRNMVRDSLVTNASTMTSEQIYGSGRTELISKVQDDVRKQVGPIGINVEKIYWIGSLRLDEKLQAAINAKIQATQIAMQRENEVATARAEAQKEIAKAEGDAQSKLLNAEAEAKAINLRGEALRNNPALVELVKAEAMKDAAAKWDGTLPTTMVPGGSVPFLNIK